MQINKTGRTSFLLLGLSPPQLEWARPAFKDLKLHLFLTGLATAAIAHLIDQHSPSCLPPSANESTQNYSR